MRSIKQIDTHYEYGNLSIEILHHNKTNRIFFVKNKQGVTYEVYTDAFALVGNTPCMAFGDEKSLDIYLHSKVFEEHLKISPEEIEQMK